MKHTLIFLASTVLHKIRPLLLQFLFYYIFYFLSGYRFLSDYVVAVEVLQALQDS